MEPLERTSNHASLGRNRAAERVPGGLVAFTLAVAS
jgi:hypothetical protein